MGQGFKACRPSHDRPPIASINRNNFPILRQAFCSPGTEPNGRNGWKAAITLASNFDRLRTLGGL